MARFVTVKCPKCGTKFGVDESWEKAFCASCGTQFCLVNQSIDLGVADNPSTGPDGAITEERNNSHLESYCNNPASTNINRNSSSSFKKTTDRREEKSIIIKGILLYIGLNGILGLTTFLFFYFHSNIWTVLLRITVVTVTLPLMGLYSWLTIRHGKKLEEQGKMIDKEHAPWRKVLVAWLVYFVILVAFFLFMAHHSFPATSSISDTAQDRPYQDADSSLSYKEEAEKDDMVADRNEKKDPEPTATSAPTPSPVYQVYFSVKSDENLFFSQYDVKLFLDDEFLDAVPNGKIYTALMELEEGSHSFEAINAEDESMSAAYTIKVEEDMTFSCTIQHSSISVDIEKVVTKTGVEAAALIVPDVRNMVLSEAKKTLEDTGFTNVQYEPHDNIFIWSNWIVVEQNIEPGTGTDSNTYIQLDCISLSEKYTSELQGMTVAEVKTFAKENGFTIRYKDTSGWSIDDDVTHMSEYDKNHWKVTKVDYSSEKTLSVTIENPNASANTPKPSNSSSSSKKLYFSTNTRETAKKGNTGVFAYCNRGKETSNYYIIDFNKGYVYYFPDGNGENYCDKVAIESGDLNSVLIITFHVGDETWSEGLHFKWKNVPDQLIVQGPDGFDYEYSPTNLEDALKIRDTKTITER